MLATPTRGGPPLHVERLFANLNDIGALLALHFVLTGEKRGRRAPLIGVLNKSGIVFAVACWEAFVEDLAVAAFESLLKKATSPDVFPKKVLVMAGKELRNNSDERRIWELSGDGWRTRLTSHKKDVLVRLVDGFHTPRPHKVDDLFESLIGMNGLSTHWRWKSSSNASVLARLDALIDLRGTIAHHVKTGRYVKKGEVEAASRLIQCLAAISSNRTGEFIKSRTGSTPWPGVKFQSIE